VQSSPAVVGGLVYVGSYDDNVYCLNAATGALVWSYLTGGPVGSSPAVVGGLVYVGSDSPDDNVYCLNATTGAYMWSYLTGGPVGSSPAVSGGVVYVGDHDGSLYALNATTGAYIWSYATGGPMPSSPAVVGGVVYVGSDDWYVYALDATTGAYLWSSWVGGSVPCSPAVANGVVYVGSESDNVYALDATTGIEIWSYKTGSGVGFSSPAVASGIVFVGSDDNKVYALDASTGAFVWSYATGGIVESSPAVANGIVYVCSEDDNVYAFGSALGSVQLTVASAYGSPSPSGTSSYTPGTSVTASVTSPVAGPLGTQYVCTGWTGTGDVPASGTGTSATFNATQNSTITWNWKTQYEVSFAQSGVGSNFTGTVVTIDGSNYNVSALPVSFWYDDGSTHSFAFQSPLVVSAGQYSWNSTTGLSTLQSASINITGPGSVTGNYVSGIHDVVVTEITTSSTWVYQGHAANVSVTVSDIGGFPENVWVTLYYNVTAGESIDAYPVYLNAGQTYTLVFTWNTAGIPYLNYTLTAVATILTGSNTLSNGTITVRLLGDVNGDGRVDLKDIALVARAFGSTPNSPNWNPAADLNGDGIVNMQDIAIVARNFGQQYP